MKIHQYKSYDDYKKVQIEANHEKLVYSWIRPGTVSLICERILAENLFPKFGLCHGTRRGEEQRLFSERLGCPVLGTEISDTATNFPNTIEWDFHNVKPEWEGSCDFVYSNSLDHAFSPFTAISAWLKCLTPNGLLIIEWAEKFGKRIKSSTEVDPFSGDTDDVCRMIIKAGGAIIDTRRMRYDKRGRWCSSNKAVASLIFARRK